MLEEKSDVILIAYYFPPHTAIGAARPHRFYKYLKLAGYRCHVVTASKQGAEAPPDVHFVPDETAALWESPRKGPLPFKAHVERAVRKVAIPAASGVAWSIDAARRCCAILRGNRDRRFVLFSSCPPVGVLLAGLLAAFRERIPWIADFRDPLINPDPRLYPLAGPVMAGLLAATFRRADAIIANTDPLGARWADVYPAARSKMHVIWNGFDPQARPEPREIPMRPCRLMAHAGELYAGRRPDLILESVARLREVDAEARRLHVLLVGQVARQGGIDQDLCDRAVREGWLDFRPESIPKPQAQRLTEEADILLLLQPQSDVQVPGKLFELLCIGRPIVALAPRASAVEYILGRAGVPHVCIYPDDEPAVRDGKLLEALRLPSRPVRFNAWFEEHFEASRQAAQLAAIIDSIETKPSAKGA